MQEEIILQLSHELRLQPPVSKVYKGKVIIYSASLGYSVFLSMERTREFGTSSENVHVSLQNSAQIPLGLDTRVSLTPTQPHSSKTMNLMHVTTHLLKGFHIFPFMMLPLPD
jgi:hypothetical protein